MVAMKWLLAALIVAAPLLLTGALDRPAPPVAPASAPDFVAQPLDPALIAPAAALPGAELLRAVCAILDPAKIVWLHTKIWQKTQEAELAYETDATLVRGPNACARLDMIIRTATKTTHQLIVSDGIVLAQSLRLGGQPEVVTSQSLPSESDAKATRRRKELLLRDCGCGSPHALLNDWAEALHQLQTAPGLWRGRPVVRVTGIMKTEPVTAILFLDAKTLWPVRLEKRQGANATPALQMEFREPILNQPLTHEECIRAFTFQSLEPAK